jgi:hypothetical protein
VTVKFHGIAIDPAFQYREMVDNGKLDEVIDLGSAGPTPSADNTLWEAAKKRQDEAARPPQEKDYQLDDWFREKQAISVSG